LGFREPFAIDSPDIPLDLLPRGHDLQAKCTENELGHLESRPVIRVPEWMLGNNGAEGRCGDLARRKRAVEHASNAIDEKVQAPDVPYSEVPCVAEPGYLVMDINDILDGEFAEAFPAGATDRGITDARTNGACTSLSIRNRLS